MVLSDSTDGIASATELAAALAIAASGLPSGQRVVISVDVVAAPKKTKKNNRKLKRGVLPSGQSITQIDAMVVDADNFVHAVYEVKSVLTISTAIKASFQLIRTSQLLSSGAVVCYRPAPTGVTYNAMFLTKLPVPDGRGVDLVFDVYTLPTVGGPTVGA